MVNLTAILIIGGLAVGGYFAYKGGYLNSILKGTGEIYPGEKADEKATPGGTPAPVEGKCPAGKVLCKDQKCEAQAECDKEGKCKGGEHWDGDLQKCVKASRAYRMTLA